MRVEGKPEHVQFEEEEHGENYIKDRVKSLTLVKNLTFLTILLLIAQIVLDSIHVSLHHLELAISLLVSAIVFLITAALVIYWSGQATKAYKANTELFQPRVNDRWTKAIYIAALIFAATCVVLLINLLAQREYSPDYVVAHSAVQATWDDHYGGRTVAGINKFLRVINWIQVGFHIYYIIYFLILARTAFKCLKFDNQAMSYLVFLGNVLLLAFGLGIVFLADHALGYSDYPKIRDNFPFWNIKGLYFAGVCVSVVSLIGFLVDHRSWRVGFFVLSFLLLVNIVLLGNFSGFAFRHIKETYNYYKGTGDINNCLERMQYVNMRDLEEYGCPQKYLPAGAPCDNTPVTPWEPIETEVEEAERANRASTNAATPAQAQEQAAAAAQAQQDAAAAAANAAAQQQAANEAAQQAAAAQQDAAAQQQAVAEQQQANAEEQQEAANEQQAAADQQQATADQQQAAADQQQTSADQQQAAADQQQATADQQQAAADQQQDAADQQQAAADQQQASADQQQAAADQQQTAADQQQTVDQTPTTTATANDDQQTAAADQQQAAADQQQDAADQQQAAADQQQASADQQQAAADQQQTSADQQQATADQQQTDANQQQATADQQQAAADQQQTSADQQQAAADQQQAAADQQQAAADQQQTSADQQQAAADQSANPPTLRMFDISLTPSRRLQQTDDGKYCYNSKCCGLLGQLYTRDLLRLANFGVLAMLAAILISVACYYFWFVKWVDSARDKRKDYVWLFIMVLVLVGFIVAMAAWNLPYVAEALDANNRHMFGWSW